MDLIEVNTPAIEEMQMERDEIISFIYSQTDSGLTLEEFTENLNGRYAELVANDQLTVGQTGISETVPPVPSACEQEVKDAQATLRTIADGIEDLESQLRWLRP